MFASNARIPSSLDLATWITDLLNCYPDERRPSRELAVDLRVTEKTINAWKHSVLTPDGPSVQLTTDNFDALCDFGRWKGRNVEIYCLGPQLWGRGSTWQATRKPLPPFINVGKSFRSHGIKLAGKLLDAALFLTSGAFSDQPDQISWMFDSGFAGVETKSKLSHARDPRQHDQLTGFSEYPKFDVSSWPKPSNVLVGPYSPDQVVRNEIGVRVGAPSEPPQEWIPKIDLAVSKMGAGQTLILSIAAHVPGSLKQERLLDDWRSVSHACEEYESWYGLAQPFVPIARGLPRTYPTRHSHL